MTKLTIRFSNYFYQLVKMRYLISNNNISVSYDISFEQYIKSIYNIKPKKSLFINTLLDDRFDIKYKYDNEYIKIHNKNFKITDKLLIYCCFTNEKRFYYIDDFSETELKYGLRFVFNKKRFFDKLLLFDISPLT